MKSELHRHCMRHVIKLLILVGILIISVNIGANTTDPCTIYGTVKDANGMGVTGAVITVENLNTKEINSNGDNTITGNPVPIVIDSNGAYTFELINLRSGYCTGDTIVVTAEKDGVVGSKTITINEGSWSEKSDITLEMVENRKEEQWYDIFNDPWTLFIMLFAIIAVILTLSLLKRKKRLKHNDRESEDVLIGNLGENEVIEGKLSTQIVENQESIIYECPECTEEIGAWDTKCPMCGVQFAES